jgi:predicted subunit of tRNA(5-methylaminomethyl-2-thiouridylate) methyltransferase
MTHSEKLIKNYSEYLSFRSFFTGEPIDKTDPLEVHTSEEATDYLKNRLGGLKDAAILLSGGMDSAILMPFMPKNTVAYTIYHEQLDEDNEVEIARKYCEKFGITHKVIAIKPQEYLDSMDALMINKKMPLSPAEPIFYIATKAAIRDGFKQIVTGGGADTCYGGASKLRKNYTPKSFQKRLERSYISPKKTLNNYADLNNILLDYLTPPQETKPKTGNFFAKFAPKALNKELIDSKRFLREIGIERFAFDNAINLAGATHVAPLKEMSYDFNEEKNRKIPKYFIQEIYESIYGYTPPKKLGLLKPTFLLKDYSPSNFDLFRKDLRVDNLRFPKKFIIYCLERFEQLRLDGKIDIDS